jgi:hypothetical protein
VGYDAALIAYLNAKSYADAKLYRCPFVDACRCPGRHPDEFVVTALAILATPWIERAPGARWSIWMKGSQQPIFGITALAGGEFEGR